VTCGCCCGSFVCNVRRCWLFGIVKEHCGVLITESLRCLVRVGVSSVSGMALLSN